MNVGPFILRPHQIRMVEGARRAIAQGHRRIILRAPTGAGKTLVSSKIIELANAKNNRTLFLASGRQLIYQKSRKLSECDIPHSVLMASEEFVSGHSNVVSSKDTLWERAFRKSKLPIPSANVVVVDEAHLASQGDSWQAIYEAYPDAVIIGFTATPSLGNGKPLPGWDAMVDGGTYEELIANGYLVQAKVFAPFVVDMKGVGVNSGNGEYVQDQMAARYDDKVLVGDIISSWQKLAENRLTGFFASSVRASIYAAQRFNEIGIPARHMDADTEQDEREYVFSAAKDGRIKVITNYGVLRIGVDIPEMRCIQLAVSVNSLSNYIQIVGRGLRPCENKQDCLIIDHGGNVHKHGWPTDDHEWSITDDRTVQERDEEKAEKEKKSREPLCCPECGAMRESGPKCLHCGHQHKRSGLKVRTVAGELRPMERKKIKQKKESSDSQKLWITCLSIAYHKHMNFKQAAYLFKQKAGQWPPDSVGPQPSSEKRGFKVRDVYPNWGRRQ